MSDYRFLLTGKWIGLTVLVLVLIPLFLLASSWQFHRLDEKRDRNAHVRTALAAPAAPLESLVDPTFPRVTDDLRWRTVAVTGRFDRGAELLVRRRFLDNAVGYWVVTPLRTTDGLVVPVLRGWVPAGRDARTAPEVAPAPAGDVDVTGRLEVPDTRRGPAPTDLPAGQVDALIPAEWQWGARVLEGSVQAITGALGPVIASDVAPTPIPAPDLDEGPHLSYAWQWRMFVLLAVVGWVILVRSNAQRERLDREEQPADVTL